MHICSWRLSKTAQTNEQKHRPRAATASAARNQQGPRGGGVGMRA